jgi:hypothetical protein
MTSERRSTFARAAGGRLGAAVLAAAVAATAVAAASRSPRALPERTGEPAPAAAPAGGSLKPVVVELFTSQGCSSCPPADAVLRTLERNQPVAGVLVVPLSEHVDYWNRLGWRDPFSSPRFSARQRTYADALDIPGLFTPMLVVDGRFVVIGSESGDVRRAIVEAAAAPKTPVAVRVAGQAASRIVELTATVGPAAPPDVEGETEVWLAITETGLATDVMGGENLFRRLRHTGVVRHIERLQTGTIPAARAPAWRITTRLRIEADWKRPNLRAVVFLQDAQTSAIRGASTVPVG